MYMCVGGVSLDHGFVILESPSKILVPGFWVPGFGDPAAWDGVPGTPVQGTAWVWGLGGIQVLEYQIGAPD